MADKMPFAGMGQEKTLDQILYYLAAIFEKMPRVDVNDRLVTNPSEVAPATTPVSGSLTTVTNLTNLNNLAGGNAAPIPFQISQMGALHLYNQIEVT